jgi:hypothetical protein
VRPAAIKGTPHPAGGKGAPDKESEFIMVASIYLYN